MIRRAQAAPVPATTGTPSTPAGQKAYRDQPSRTDRCSTARHTWHTWHTTAHVTEYLAATGTPTRRATTSQRHHATIRPPSPKPIGTLADTAAASQNARLYRETPPARETQPLACRGLRSSTSTS